MESKFNLDMAWSKLGVFSGKEKERESRDKINIIRFVSRGVSLVEIEMNMTCYEIDQTFNFYYTLIPETSFLIIQLII